MSAINFLNLCVFLLIVTISAAREGGVNIYITGPTNIISCNEVGVECDVNTVVEEQNPEDLANFALSTKLSLYVKTLDLSGLIMFMGTPEGGSQYSNRIRTDDFMALEIDGGFVRVTTDLGAGAHTIENYQFISDGVWRKISLERMGRIVKLSVHSEDDEKIESFSSVEEVIPGAFSVFNLDPEISKIYIGEIPEGVWVDNSLHSTLFDGQIEDLQINDRPVEFWNFMMDGTDNVKGSGAIQRDRFVDLLPTTVAPGCPLEVATMVSFEKSAPGFVELEIEIPKGYGIQLVFKFRTQHPNGLLFYSPTLNQADDISLSLTEGILFLRTPQGTVRTGNHKYNDGKWHVVYATFEDIELHLRIDDNEDYSRDVSSLAVGLNGAVYFGGVPSDFRLPNGVAPKPSNFAGCIAHATFNDHKINFAKSTNRQGARLQKCS